MYEEEPLIIQINELKEENERLKKEVEVLKAHLKRYTAPPSSKKYYQEHKEKHKQKVSEYQKRTNYHANLPSEKKKQYARTAYLNAKEKKRLLLEKLAMDFSEQSEV
jgi:wyosine [tRNA(Phe)-imidazoG37] synthetase (radical SAM superfamily)